MYKALDQSIRDSEKLADISDFAYRVWAQGLAASDMVGRISGSPKKFWAEAMPLTQYDQTKISRALNELVDAKLIHRYDVDGKAYIVYHEHEDYNKAGKNLKYQNKSKCPPPTPGLCYCVTFTRFEDTPVSTDTGIPQKPVSTDTGVTNSAVSADVHVHVPVHVHSSDKRGLVGERRASNALAEVWNDGPGEHLNGKSAAEKIQAAIDVGVDPQVIEQAFWDHNSIKGRKIWEVLDPLRPIQSPPGVKSMFQVLAEFKGDKP